MSFVKAGREDHVIRDVSIAISRHGRIEQEKFPHDEVVLPLSCHHRCPLVTGRICLRPRPRYTLTLAASGRAFRTRHPVTPAASGCSPRPRNAFAPAPAHGVILKAVFPGIEALQNPANRPFC